MWVITYPDGHNETIKNLQKFCMDQNLSYDSMLRSKCLRKTKNNKNYQCKKLEGIT